MENERNKQLDMFPHPEQTPDIEEKMPNPEEQEGIENFINTIKAKMAKDPRRQEFIFYFPREIDNKKRFMDPLDEYDVNIKQLPPGVHENKKKSGEWKYTVIVKPKKTETNPEKNETA